MSHISRKIIISVLLAGCGGEARVEQIEGPARGDDQTSITASVVVPQGEDASIGTYNGTVTYPQGDTFEISGTRDGVLEQYWLSSIDGDDRPELVIWMVSAGSGSYATIHLYRMEKDGPEFIDISELPHGARQGYLGHDRVFLEDGRLRRCFPLYDGGDPNSDPSAGRRCLTYDSSGLWLIE